jgi:hypothetical protein
MVDGDECPLLLDLFPRFLSDFGWENRACEPDIYAEVFDRLKTSDVWKKSGSKVTPNRFMQAIRASEQEDSLWTVRLHSQLYTCIQEDMMTGESFRKHFERVPVVSSSAVETGKVAQHVSRIRSHGMRDARACL